MIVNTVKSKGIFGIPDIEQKEESKVKDPGREGVMEQLENPI